MPRIIAILSDLGTRDYFVGAMKGTILAVNPKAEIVDITHEIPKQDIRSAAFVLANAAETFPPGSIFVAVVDPGVGTERRCLLLRTLNGLSFIAPDNGILTLVTEQFGVEEIREVKNRKLMRPCISATFHGRDVMAPVAAHLSLGLKPEEVGPKIGKIRRLKTPKPELKGDELRGEILYIDDFGNLVTNINAELVERFAKLGETLDVKIGGKRIIAEFARTFGEIPPHQPLCYIGSARLLELSENMGDLADELGVSIGEPVTLKKLKEPEDY